MGYNKENGLIGIIKRALWRLGANDDKCSWDQRLNMPSEARKSTEVVSETTSSNKYGNVTALNQ
jgi:hypothetical protein